MTIGYGPPVHGPPADPALLSEAVDLCRAAGELTRRWFGTSGLAVERKADGTPVTDADRAAERFLRQEIERRHPYDGILGEEEAERPGSSGRRWIIDPIDGTKAFTRGVPLYTTLLAVWDEHGPAVGVIDMPALGETVYAGRGLGCHFDGEACRVSTRGQLSGAWMTTSGFEHWDEGPLAAIHRSGMAMRTWGDGYGYALVATGRLDAMVDPAVAPYDVAPMPVILEEAGGRFTDWAGRRSIDGGNGVASNGLVHDELLRALHQRS